MSGIHSNCVPIAQYWSMYNKFKGDGYYIESRKLRAENKLLKDTIVELESKLKAHVTPPPENKFKDTIKTYVTPHVTPPPLVVRQVKSITTPNLCFYRGSQINHRTTERATDYNRCKAIRSSGRQCKQCNNSNQAGGPILNGYCGYHSHRR